MNLIIVIAGAAILFLTLLALIIILFVNLRKTQARLDRFIGAREEANNLESIILEYMAKVKQVDGKYEEVISKLNKMNRRLNCCIQKSAIIRYNPFDNMGGDLCFVICLLDEMDNGILINTIHGRDATYTYAKPIVALESQYVLSEEEKNVLQMAVEKYQSNL